MSSTNNTTKPVLAYWNFRGLGNPIRLMLAYFQIDHEDKRYASTLTGLRQWGKDKPGLSSSLEFPNLPYWKEGGGGVGVTESRAILKYLAREKDNGALMPKDPALITKAEIVEGVLYDVWYLLVHRCLYDTDPFIQDMDRKSPPILQQLDKSLGSKKWLLGDQISYVDFILYEVIYSFSAYNSSLFTNCGSLLTFKKNFEALPEIEKYVASPEYIKGPNFHPMFAKHKI